LRGDDYVYGVAIGFYVEGAVGRELQKIETCQVAGGVIEEHVLAAWIAGVDPRGVFRGMPAIHGGVVLHAGIAAGPGGFGKFVEKVFGFVGVDYAAVDDRSRREIVSRRTATMKSSVTRTELLAFLERR